MSDFYFVNLVILMVLTEEGIKRNLSLSGSFETYTY